MRNSSLARLLLKSTRRKFHGIAGNNEVSNWRAALKNDLAIKFPKERKTASIYKVPVKMREVQPDAYVPNIISIGPYHHGDKRLQEMEELKWDFFHRLFGPKKAPDIAVELDHVMNAMEDLEQEARKCYWDEAEQIKKDKFVKIMLVDGCFIVELFRELKQSNFHYCPSVKRWMLPTLRRDLIMLENQIPLFVLQRLFKLTRRSKESTLEELALMFFNPLLKREHSNNPDIPKGIGEMQHFLDLFRLSILPNPKMVTRAAESDMKRSMTELMESGVVVEKSSVNRPPLDVRCDGRWLQIPPLYIDDYKGTLIRNMVAYEQCHSSNCKPADVTSYLFFFDGLINSAHDVELLHHKGVLQHSLGSNKEVAKLVNGLCKEIARDSRESYLHEVVFDINSYCDSSYAKIRARLVHHYFSNWVVGISTFGALIVLYLTVIQTCYGYVKDQPQFDKPFHHHLLDSITLPILHLFTFEKNQEESDEPEFDEPFHYHLLNSIIVPICQLFTLGKNKEKFWHESTDDEYFQTVPHWVLSV
ncbi:hypothetical protein CCACVL1_16379 [Corchorus capsularis]|uniref:Uncharacterized protein n=1 Tax=Corchorus capsularis TaxID=210143 RepID=A0A1R3HXE1_COCAP|nr:hypothetical protein CCACVL1_16379 [Corchorus capsularis]